MRKAMAALTEQRSRKRKYVRPEESRIVGDLQDLMAESDGGGEEAAEQQRQALRTLWQDWPQLAHL